MGKVEGYAVDTPGGTRRGSMVGINISFLLLGTRIAYALSYDFEVKQYSRNARRKGEDAGSNRNRTRLATRRGIYLRRDSRRPNGSLYKNACQMQGSVCRLELVVCGGWWVEVRMNTEIDGVVVSRSALSGVTRLFENQDERGGSQIEKGDANLSCISLRVRARRSDI